MNDTFLERRLKLLFTNFNDGKILFPSTLKQDGEHKRLLEELQLVRALPDGSIDIKSATPLVRSFARTFYSLDNYIKQEAQVASKLIVTETISIPEIISLQREYFQLIEDLFVASTGVSHAKFIVEGEDFSSGIHKRDPVSLAKLTQKSYEIYIPKLQEFYVKKSHLLIKSKDTIGGFKCVFGGSSRFNQSAYDSYRKIALYSDTVFIPDPILPWLEVERSEEQFNLVNILQACYYLLKLKPMVDADLPYPAIIVFPSWEKTLEKNNDDTKDGIADLIIRFFSHYLNCNFEDEQEIFQYILGKGNKNFRSTVVKKKLFIPPNSISTESFDTTYANYLEFLKENRSDEFVKMILSVPPEMAVYNGIAERIGPQYHVLDNAKMLNANPLFYLPVFYHYYQLCSDISQSDFTDLGIINKKTLDIINSLNHPSVNWLGNVPFEDLVIFRKDNLNGDFRERITTALSELQNINYENVNSAAAEIGHSLSTLITEHNKTARKIADNYMKKHLITAGISILSLGVCIYPILGPLVGKYAALSPLGKYMYDNMNQYYENKPLKQSMVGILADAYNKQ